MGEAYYPVKPLFSINDDMIHLSVDKPTTRVLDFNSGRHFSLQVGDSQRVTVVALDPLLQIEQQSFISDVSLMAEHLAFVDDANRMVLASGELFDQLMKNPEQLPKGFKLKKVSKEELVELVLFIQKVAKDAIDKSKESSEEKKAEVKERIVVPVKVEVSSKEGIHSSSKQSESLALSVSTLADSLLRKVIEEERTIIRQLWKKYSDAILYENERSKIRALENLLKSEILESLLLKELAGESDSTLEIREGLIVVGKTKVSSGQSFARLHTAA